MSTSNQNGYRNEVIDWLKTETTGKCICGAKLFVNPQGKIKCKKCPQAVIDCGDHKPAMSPARTSKQKAASLMRWNVTADETICDRCDHYSRSPGGCVESCAMVRNEPFSRFTSYYAEPRLLGNATNCKEFTPIKAIAKAEGE